jgi:hypothetical protein
LPLNTNNLNFIKDAKDQNELRCQKKIYSYRNGKNQEKARLSQSHSDKEDEEAEKKSSTLCNR